MPISAFSAGRFTTAALVFFAALVAACDTQAPVTPDGGLDAGAEPARLTLSQLEPASIDCNSLELHIDVRKGQHVSGLPASAFTTALTDGAGAAAGSAESCFSEVLPDGGAEGYYRFCYSGLRINTPYFLAMSVTSAGDTASTTFGAVTAACDAGVSDAAADAAAEAGAPEAGTIDP